MVTPCPSPLNAPVGGLHIGVGDERSRPDRAQAPWWRGARGSSWTRIAGCVAPATMTSPTPDTCEIRCAMTVSVASKIALVGMVSEVSASTSTGAPEELALRKVGRVDRSVGRSVAAALIAACTSRAAASMLRSMSNCAMICVDAERAYRGQFVEAGDVGQPPFERRGDRGRHGLGIGAGARGGDADHRKIDGRQARDGQKKIGDRADQEQREREQRRADRPPDERRGDVHSAASLRSRQGPRRRRRRLRPPRPPPARRPAARAAARRRDR